MTLRVVYRACGSSNTKKRPPFFSKTACLASFLRSVTDVSDVDLVFLCDGDMPDRAIESMAAFGEVSRLPGIGNSRSYLAALERALMLGRDDDLLYLCEDDYLYVPSAFEELVRAAKDVPQGTYLTLYDHPDRYTRTDDARTPGQPVAVFGDRHWRRVESTNMTFAVGTATLRPDQPVHQLFARYSSYPHDRAMWRTLQALGVRRPLSLIRPRRQLFGAVPTLATHVEQQQLAPLVDWQEVAHKSLAWASDGPLSAVDGW